jgi:hypothetical protein
VPSRSYLQQRDTCARAELCGGNTRYLRFMPVGKQYVAYTAELFDAIRRHRSPSRSLRGPYCRTGRFRIAAPGDRRCRPSEDSPVAGVPCWFARGREIPVSSLLTSRCPGVPPPREAEPCAATAPPRDLRRTTQCKAGARLWIVEIVQRSAIVSSRMIERIEHVG